MAVKDVIINNFIGGIFTSIGLIVGTTIMTLIFLPIAKKFYKKSMKKLEDNILSKLKIINK